MTAKDMNNSKNNRYTAVIS